MGLFGNSKEKNQKKAAQFFEIGLDYYEGNTKPKNLVQAMSYFRQSAEKDNVDACRALGWIYLYEPDFNHNVTEAVRWYEKGAAAGDIQCCYNLAVVLSNEDEVKNYHRAYELFCQAAKAGNADSCYSCARFCQDGMGIEKNEEEAKEWYKKAHKAGHPQAAEDLAILWESDIIELDFESETDCRLASERLEQAAHWHEAAAAAAEETAVKNERINRAADCRAAAADYIARAEKIREEIREAWMSAPEPKLAFCIVLCGDYDPVGKEVMRQMKAYIGQNFTYTEGVREEYSFFWFEDRGQAVEITCYYDSSRMLQLLQEGNLPVSRMILLLSEEEGLSENMRLCLEGCWKQDCYSVLPLMVTSDEPTELSKFVEADLMAFARSTGCVDDPVLYRVSEEPKKAMFWCPSVLDSEETWWRRGRAIVPEIMEEVLMDRVEGAEETAGESTEKPAEDSTEEASGASMGEAAEAVVEEAAEDATEETSKKPAEDSMEETSKVSTGEKAEQAAEDAEEPENEEPTVF